MLLTVFRKSPLTMAIAGILGLSALPAQALIMDTSAAYSQTLLNSSYEGGGSPLANAASSSASEVHGFSFSEVYGVFGPSSREWSRAMAHADATGNINVEVEGVGEFDNSATAYLSETFLNTSSKSQTYTFDFNVAPGVISAMIYDMVNGLDADGYIESMFSLSIKVNGVVVWGSSLGFAMTGKGELDVYQSGVSLGKLTTEAGSAIYEWDAYSGRAALGTFAPGEAFALSYEMTTFSRSVGSGGSDGCTDRVYGEPIYDPSGDYWLSTTIEVPVKCPKAGTVIVVRDPFALSSVLLDDSTVRGSAVTSPVTSVPVPASLGLAGVGIAGLAFARRRRAK